jgi:hypothetical protein
VQGARPSAPPWISFAAIGPILPTVHSPLELDCVGFRHTSQHRENLLKRKGMHLGRPTCGGVLWQYNGIAVFMSRPGGRLHADIGCYPADHHRGHPPAAELQVQFGAIECAPLAFCDSQVRRFGQAVGQLCPTFRRAAGWHLRWAIDRHFQGIAEVQREGDIDEHHRRPSGPEAPSQQAEYDAIHGRAAVATPEELADTLIDLFLKLYPQTQAATALLESRTDWTAVRKRFRAQALTGVRTALTICAPDLDDNQADDVAAVVLNNMKTMVGMTRKDAPTSRGAPDELRLMNRLYLAAKLRTGTPRARKKRDN